MMSVDKADVAVGVVSIAGLLAIAATSVAVGLGSGSATEYVPPVCWEDEVILHDGSCFPMDDSTYTDGYWWPLSDRG